MANKDTIDEKIVEQSKSLFWVIQTIFGLVIAQSFYMYASEINKLLGLNFHSVNCVLIFALVSIYYCVINSWIDYSTSVSRYAYQLEKGKWEWIRFFSDLFVVLIYTLLLDSIKALKDNPNSNIFSFLIDYVYVYSFYSLSGIARIKTYGKKASNIRLIFYFLAYFIVLLILYKQSYFHFVRTRHLVNIPFIFATVIFTCLYRSIRRKKRGRKYTIAVDIDGVLSNQIVGILPVIKKKYGMSLAYENVDNWNKPIVDTSIDKIIGNKMKNPKYVLGMPTHSNAAKVVSRLIKKHRIVIVSARPANFTTKISTTIWLFKNRISYDESYSAKEGRKQESEENYDVLIDDYVGNIKPFLEKQEGKAILFSQPWNQNYFEIKSFVDNGKLLVALKWDEVEFLISKLLESK